MFHLFSTLESFQADMVAHPVTKMEKIEKQNIFVLICSSTLNKSIIWETSLKDLYLLAKSSLALKVSSFNLNTILNCFQTSYFPL
jgi:hypothetical protein